MCTILYIAILMWTHSFLHTDIYNFTIKTVSSSLPNTRIPKIIIKLDDWDYKIKVISITYVAGDYIMFI